MKEEHNEAMEKPFPSDERVVTHAGMTRAQQTWLIVGAIFGALVLYFAYDATVNPNLDGMHPYDRCSYWAYYHNHGGSVKVCQDREMQAVYDRVANHEE